MRPHLALLTAAAAVLTVYALALAQPTRRAYLPQLASNATPRPSTATPSATPSPTVTSSPTLVPAGALEINDVVLRDPAFPDISEEYTQVRNVTEHPVALAGWTIRNASRPEVPAYVFPAFSLAGDLTISVFTAVGNDDLTNGDFYWDQATDVWQVGDRAELRDPSGRLISFLIVPSQND